MYNAQLVCAELFNRVSGVVAKHSTERAFPVVHATIFRCDGLEIGNSTTNSADCDDRTARQAWAN
jgi:hypothetical protein